MRRVNTKLPHALIIFLFLLSSCVEKNDEKSGRVAVLAEENELLKKEIVRLTKEERSNSKNKTVLNEEPNVQNNNADNLDYLKDLDGKYPRDVKLFSNAMLKERLKKLLKHRYEFTIEKWAVETPIKVKNGVFIADGCELHNCGYTNFIIVYDFTKALLYAGVREEMEAETFSEDGSSHPEIISWLGDDSSI